MGKYDSQAFDEDLAELKKEIEEGTELKPQKMKIENMNMPFYQLTMEGGTLCDLNGKPRVTRVHYVCYPAGKVRAIYRTAFNVLFEVSFYGLYRQARNVLV